MNDREEFKRELSNEKLRKENSQGKGIVIQGAYCYKGFRHSFCHGWSVGVICFIKEFL
jgi:hypothetical protein